LAEKRVEPCTACGACREEPYGSCTIDDDDFDEVFQAMLGADIIIVGSPVYFGSATPQIMALLDRAGYVARAEQRFARKLGGPVVVARRAGQNFTYAQLMYWFMISDMIVPGSSYWNIAFGAEPGDAGGDAEAIATLDRFVGNLAWLARKIEG
jgi:multimeric flavodoxin WrbA